MTAPIPQPTIGRLSRAFGTPCGCSSHCRLNKGCFLLLCSPSSQLGLEQHSSIHDARGPPPDAAQHEGTAAPVARRSARGGLRPWLRRSVGEKGWRCMPWSCWRHKPPQFDHQPAFALGQTSGAAVAASVPCPTCMWPSCAPLVHNGRCPSAPARVPWSRGRTTSRAWHA